MPPHPTPLRGATFSRKREKEEPRLVYVISRAEACTPETCTPLSSRTWPPLLTRFLATLALLIAAAAPAPALMPSAQSARASASAMGLPLTPQMFGAIGDGRADDSAAITAWLGSGRALACNGTFKVTRHIAVDLTADSGLSIQGAGRQLCKIVLATPAAGLRIGGGEPDLYHTPQVVMHDLSLVPAVPLEGPALEIAYRGGSGMTDPTLDLRNIAIKPADENAYAPTCIRLDNVRNGVAQAINCEGRRTGYAAGSRGIVVTGNAQPVELTLRDVNAYFVDEGIALEGTWQGVAITDGVCVVCRVGVEATASDNAGVWLRVIDSHFNVEDFGIETVNIATVNAIGNFVYLDDVGPSRATMHACFSMRMLSQATAWTKVQGNSCDGTQLAATPRYGVHLDSARPPSRFLMGSRIDGNSFYKLDWGVYLANTASVAVGPNTFSFMAKGDIWRGSDGRGLFEDKRTPREVPLSQGAN